MAVINESNNVRAFLDMIARSEGTSTNKESDNGYNVVVGGSLFHDYTAHPNKLISLPKLNIKSTAAGRYQLLYRYWLAYSKSLNLPDFGPMSQDKIALQQIRERKALKDIEAGNVELAIAKTKNIWASLPGAGYGQHEHKLETLLTAYTKAGGQIT